MKDELVQLSTAMILERKGFGKAYNKYSKSSLTTQTSAARWLRENKNLNIEVFATACGYSFEICKANNGEHIAGDSHKGSELGGYWDTYEAAMEEGIINSLSLITKQ